MSVVQQESIEIIDLVEDDDEDDTMDLLQTPGNLILQDGKDIIDKENVPVKKQKERKVKPKTDTNTTAEKSKCDEKSSENRNNMENKENSGTVDSQELNDITDSIDVRRNDSMPSSSSFTKRSSNEKTRRSRSDSNIANKSESDIEQEKGTGRSSNSSSTLSKSSSNENISSRDGSVNKNSLKSTKCTFTEVTPLSINKLGQTPKKSTFSVEITDGTKSRAKPVKTYRSQFRSHGLEVAPPPPPPPRRGLQRPTLQPTACTSSKMIPTATVSKAFTPHLDQNNGSESVAEKPGIETIPAKPRIPAIVESDMFMGGIFESPTKKTTCKRKATPKKVQTHDVTHSTLDKEQKDAKKNVTKKIRRFHDKDEPVTVISSFIDLSQSKRKMNSDDVMKEQIPYSRLFIVDNVPPLPETKSKEKQIRIKPVSSWLRSYFGDPDSPMEPEFQLRQITDPIEIPLNGVNDNPEAIENFSGTQLQELRGSSSHQPSSVYEKRDFPNFQFNFPYNNQPRWNLTNVIPPSFHGSNDNTEAIRNHSSTSLQEPRGSSSQQSSFGFENREFPKFQTNFPYGNQPRQNPFNASPISLNGPGDNREIIRNSSSTSLQEPRESSSLKLSCGYENREFPKFQPNFPYGNQPRQNPFNASPILLNGPGDNREVIRNSSSTPLQEPRGSSSLQLSCGYENREFPKFQTNLTYNKPALIPPNAMSSSFNSSQNMLSHDSIKSDVSKYMPPFKVNVNIDPPDGLSNIGSNFKNIEGRYLPDPAQKREVDQKDSPSLAGKKKKQLDWNPKNICRPFANGFCRFGKRCNRLHPGENCPKF